MAYLNFKSCNIYYELINGNEKKPYLIFLHEGLGCIKMWKSFPEKLCKTTGCPGIVYDRKGYGNSSPLDNDWGIDYHSYYAHEELPFLLDSVIPGKPYFLIGHSDGATISLLHASKKNQLLKGIISEAAHVIVESETVESVKFAEESFKNEKLDKLYKYHGDKTERVFNTWAGTWSSSWFSSWHMIEHLPQILSPLLVIQGENDRYGTEKQYNTIISKVSGEKELSVIPECGHSPHITKQKLTISLTAGFIEKYLQDC